MPLEPFTDFSGHAAPLPESDVDTDIIFPARYLLITKRKGLAQYAFYDRKFGPGGDKDESFCLNRDPYAGAPILVTGANFGCGSSREQAVWALADAGVKCVIAPSFGEIFKANCLRNGLLPLSLSQAEVDRAMAIAMDGKEIEVSLSQQTVHLGNGGAVPFAIAPQRKQALAQGWDETDLIRNQFRHDIDEFEKRQAATQPWLYESAGSQ